MAKGTRCIVVTCEVSKASVFYLSMWPASSPDLINPSGISNFFFFVNFILGKQSLSLYCLHLSSHTPPTESGSHCQHSQAVLQ